MTAARLLQCFRVDDENSLLLGVLHVVRAQHALAAENAEVDDQETMMTVKYASKMQALRELEERILDLVQKAREKAR
jgi:hypothetical protein